jgi:integrase
VGSFDVRVFAIRRRPSRTAFEVRWRVAGRDKSRSFITRALADSYRAELVRAARKGAEFDPVTGEPAVWAAAEPAAVSWYQHAVAYAEMKWPGLAPHSRASLADALVTLTPLLTRETGRMPSASRLRAALYGHAFNPQQRRSGAPDLVTAAVLGWLEHASLPVGQLSDPRVIRAALDGLCVRLDGLPAAANTIRRKRAVFHGALGYAVELGLLTVNPMGKVRWHAPGAAVALNPATVASPAQVRAILAQVMRARPALAAFFGCLYYAALRPEEAVALHRKDLIVPAHGRGNDYRGGRLPAHRRCLDQHRDPARTPRPEAPSRRDDPRRAHPACPGPDAPPSPPRLRHYPGRGAVPRDTWRHAQRIGLRPRLARRPPGRARAGTGRHRARPPSP